MPTRSKQTRGIFRLSLTRNLSREGGERGIEVVLYIPCQASDQLIDISWYIPFRGTMTEHTGTAKLFKHGRSQAVRLPKEFRMPGTEVRVRRIGRGVLLEPIGTPFDVKAWFAKLDEYRDEPFMPEGRQQPPNPPARKVFEE